MQYEELFENNPPADLSFMKDLVDGFGKENVQFRRWTLEGNDQAILCTEGLLIYRPYIGKGTPIYIHIEFEEERIAFWPEGRKEHVEISDCMDGDCLVEMVVQLYAHAIRNREGGNRK